MEVPYIKLFKANKSFYVYDVNTNIICKISEESYRILSDRISKKNTETYFCSSEEVERMENLGLLKPNKILGIGNKIAENKKEILGNEVSSLLLQITRNCNLRCKYCFYSGNYENIRTHSESYLDWSVAKQAIDFLNAHSSNKNDISIGFYGGEPLLNFSMIKKCVDYANHLFLNKNIEYSITTNGVLLKNEIADFLINHNFKINISVDGPKNVHDKNRIFINNHGSYDIIIDNLKCLKEKNSDFYKKYVRYNAVYTGEFSERDIKDYFKYSMLFKDLKGKLSPLNNYHKNSISLNNKFNSVNKTNRGVEKLFSMYNIIKGNMVCCDESLETLYGISDKLTYQYIECEKLMTSSGLCFPGISKLFCTIKGDLYICEKVNDNSEECKIGDIFSGFDMNKIDILLSMGNKTKTGCKNCWAIRLCNMCQAKMVNFSAKDFAWRCDYLRKQILINLKDICTLNSQNINIDEYK